VVVNVDHDDGRSAYAIPARFRFLVLALGLEGEANPNDAVGLDVEGLEGLGESC